MDNDRQRSILILRRRVNGNSQPVAPRALGEYGDLLLAAVELVVTVGGFQNETVEISEVIEDDPQPCP